MGIRIDKKIIATMFGIAICVMYLVGTIAVVEGLGSTTERTADMFKRGPFLVYKGDTISESRISNDIVEKLEGEFAVCSIVKANVSGFYARVVWIQDTYNILSLNISENNLIGENLYQMIKSSNITIDDVLVTLEGRYRSDLIPNDWVIVKREIILSLNPEFEDYCSFLVIPDDNKGAIEFLKSNGFVVSQTLGIVEFFELGIYQIGNDLWGIIIFSALIIIVLVYSIMNIEIKSRTPDIKILRKLGGSSNTVMTIFLFETLFISSTGAFLGCIFGIIISNALLSVSSLLGFESFITPEVTLYSIVLPIAIAIISGMIGGSYLSFKASRINIKEVE